MKPKTPFSINNPSSLPPNPAKAKKKKQKKKKAYSSKQPPIHTSLPPWLCNPSQPHSLKACCIPISDLIVSSASKQPKKNRGGKAEWKSRVCGLK